MENKRQLLEERDKKDTRLHAASAFSLNSSRERETRQGRKTRQGPTQENTPIDVAPYQAARSKKSEEPKERTKIVCSG